MRWTMAVLAAGLAGCTAARNVWRPEGDGGWSAAKRREAVSALAPQAGVVDPLAAPTPAPGPTVYNLAAALAEARGGNRPMQAEALRVGIARQRALEARGRLLPTTTARGALHLVQRRAHHPRRSAAGRAGAGTQFESCSATATPAR